MLDSIREFRLLYHSGAERCHSAFCLPVLVLAALGCAQDPRGRILGRVLFRVPKWRSGKVSTRLWPVNFGRSEVGPTAFWDVSTLPEMDFIV